MLGLILEIQLTLVERLTSTVITPLCHDPWICRPRTLEAGCLIQRSLSLLGQPNAWEFSGKDSSLAQHPSRCPGCRATERHFCMLYESFSRRFLTAKDRVSETHLQHSAQYINCRKRHAGHHGLDSAGHGNVNWKERALHSRRRINFAGEFQESLTSI